MDFVLWIFRVLHVGAVVVWVGGVVSLVMILNPSAEHEDQTRSAMAMTMQKRYFGFWVIWLLVVLASGAVLTTFSPQFAWFDYSTPWRKLLGVKQLSFLLVALYTWQAKRLLGLLERSARADVESFKGLRTTYVALTKRIIVIALIALLSSAAMVVYQHPFGQ
jgi:uncharacterized membrane protein